MVTVRVRRPRRLGATMQGKQAKIVSPTQERAILGFLETTRYPSRDRVMFLLSMKAGLRAKEIASLTWAMVTDAQGQIAETIQVPNRASKGTPVAAPFRCTPTSRPRWGRCRRGAARRPDPISPGSSPSVGVGCRRRRCACGSTGSIRRSRWTAVRRIPGVGPLLPAPPAKCPRSGEPPGRAGTRRPYQPGHDATVYRRRHGSQAQAGRADLVRADAEQQTIHGWSAVCPPHATPSVFTSGGDEARDGPHAAALRSQLRRGHPAPGPATRQWPRVRPCHPVSRQSQSRASGRCRGRL
jgi:hypothetical protein